MSLRPFYVIVSGIEFLKSPDGFTVVYVLRHHADSALTELLARRSLDDGNTAKVAAARVVEYRAIEQ